MDPALLRERELFKRRALATPAIERKKKEPEKNTTRDEPAKKKHKISTPSSTVKHDVGSYKSMAGTSQYKFAVLAKIVNHMKTKYLEGDNHGLTIDEILDETKQLDVGSKVKIWLQAEALIQNPKIEVTDSNKYVFKPKFKLVDKKSLLRLLKRHDLKGLGGILLEEIQESLPKCEKALKATQLEIDDEFKKLWRSVAVDGMDDEKIDEYLDKQGITSMRDHGPKKSAPMKRKKSNKRKVPKKPRDNDHLADVLENYDEAK
ncbi:hypothetical protein HCN44_009874 [Aphidius gifuensis]|uniref:Transcription initiation factor IIE subunit beta n=1 Tax=Aphidius gifuensis TaxID=684658 RepID=A0A835CP26_APHGI|nr:hypothetical protein HCN44_009874 [Aphidius gifuensis]